MAGVLRLVCAIPLTEPDVPLSGHPALITAYAQDLSVFLNESELTERRAFIESFVKEIVIMPGNAVVRYTIPMPQDSPIGGMDAEEVALHAPVLSTVKFGGPKLTVDRTIFEMRMAL